MKISNHVKGTIFAILGLVLFFISIGDVLFRLMLAIVALGLIRYGLTLRGFPSLNIFMHRWRNNSWHNSW